MNRQKAEKVREIAEELLGMLDEYIEACIQTEKFDAKNPDTDHLGWRERHALKPKQMLTGAIRRRSMDLTRALANLRKYN